MSPTYERYEWIHDLEDEPSLIYCELDDERCEIRKIEVFKDGRSIGVSEEYLQLGATGLGEGPGLAVEEINAHEEFRA
jgi:hypothetical protein